MGREAIQLSPGAEVTLGELGAEVRAARRERGLSAEQLAELAGVSKRTVLSLEAGSPAVSVGNALNIAAAVGVEFAVQRRRVEPDRIYF